MLQLVVGPSSPTNAFATAAFIDFMAKASAATSLIQSSDVQKTKSKSLFQLVGKAQCDVWASVISSFSSMYWPARNHHRIEVLLKPHLNKK